MTATLAERAEAVAERADRPRRRVRDHDDNGGNTRSHTDSGGGDNGKRARVPKPERESETRDARAPGAPGAIGWLRAGCSPSLAAERAAAEFGVDGSAALGMVAAAVAELAGALWTGGREGRLALAVEQRERVLAEAMGSGDWKLALAALESREKLMGLFGDAPSTGAETLLDLLRNANSD